MEPPADWDIKRPGAEEKAGRRRLRLGYMLEQQGGGLMRVRVIKDEMDQKVERSVLTRTFRLFFCGY